VSGPAGPFFAMLNRNGFRLMLETAQSPDPPPGAAGARGAEARATVNLYLSVEDVGAEAARLQAAGVAHEGPVVKPYGMKEVTFQDPDGYTWTIGQKVA